MVRKLGANTLRAGRPLKKYKCDSHAQSDAPNPARGMDAPRIRLIQDAQRHSHGIRSWQYQISSGLACARR